MQKNKKKINALSCYEVMITKLCNAKCFFCSQDHKSRILEKQPNDTEIYKRILFWKKEWYWMLGFTWWEPLIHPNILKYIKFWKKIWFDLVRIQTNGIMLWEPWFAKKCVEVWTTLFKFSIHHYKSEIHDYLVWSPWALSKCIYSIKEVKKVWARIWINIVLTKQNYKDLPEILLYFLDLWVNDFVIIFPLYEHSMLKEVKKVWIKFTKTIPYLVKSLQIFDKLWLKKPLILNLPLCLFKWYEHVIIDTFNGTAVLNLDWSKTNIDKNKSIWKKRLTICKDCKHNKLCFWIDKEYLNIWWEWGFKQKKEKLNYKFDLNDLKLKKYFTEDELCFFEILNKKNIVSVWDIFKIKDSIQICQDCDSMNKIISTWEILIKKWYIKKEMKLGKIFYKKIWESPFWKQKSKFFTKICKILLSLGIVRK